MAKRPVENMPRGRVLARGVFTKALLSNPEIASLDAEQLDAISRRLERSCYNHVVLQCQQEFRDATWENISFVGRYQSLVYMYASNLDAGSSLQCGHLATGILDGSIDPSRIVEYTSRDVNPEASAEERGTIEVRQRQKVEKKSTDRYQCKKCLARRATVEEVQRKRVDDGGTSRIQCLECGEVWFKNGV